MQKRKKKTITKKSNIYSNVNSKAKNRNEFLKMSFKGAWDYIKDSRKFIFIAFGIFILFTLIGLLVPVPEFLRAKIISFLQELAKQTEGMNFYQLFWFIFKNNIQASFLGLFLGIIFGIFPLGTSAANGYVLGFVSAVVINEKGVIYLATLLPHGIFELPALFISLGLGLKLGVFLFSKMFLFEKKETLKKVLFKSLNVFLFIVLPLLLIAAIIETSLIMFLG